jgi:hypothetical protein
MGIGSLCGQSLAAMTEGAAEFFNVVIYLGMGAMGHRRIGQAPVLYSPVAGDAPVCTLQIGHPDLSQSNGLFLHSGRLLENLVMPFLNAAPILKMIFQWRYKKGNQKKDAGDGVCGIEFIHNIQN